jgi:L-ascorbate metabolism protein UlaG (beta-lactamase superfamily)
MRRRRETLPKLTFLGHATLLLETAGQNILVDPFISGNPAYPKDFRLPHIDVILLTHYHSDHLGDTVAVAKENGALVVSTNEVAMDLGNQGCTTRPMHIGGGASFPFGTVKLVPAIHGAGIPGGLACGFVVASEGRRVYFAGDTALFGDMRLIGERYGPLDVALLPIGSNFTMDVEDAAYAARLLQPKTLVPIHYNTWPLIAADPSALATALAGTGIRLEVLEPGRSLTF